MSTDGTFLKNAVEADTAWVGCAWTTCGRSLFNTVQEVYINVEIHLESCWEEIVNLFYHFALEMNNLVDPQDDLAVSK